MAPQTFATPSASFTLTATLSTPPRPLALIIGFLGATPRILAALARPYAALDYDIALCAPPPHVVFSASPSPKAAYAAALAAALTTLGAEKLVLAPFSNAGAYTVIHLCSALRDAESTALLDSVVAVVYDSAPCFFSSPVLGARALRSALTTTNRFVAVQAAWMSALFWAGNVLRTGEGTGGLGTGIGKAVFPRASELFLYSDSDELCDSGQLEAFLKTRTIAPGRVVLRERFSGTSHCAHFKACPDRYLAMLKVLDMTAVRSRLARL